MISIRAGVNARLLRDGPKELIIETIKRYIDKLGRDHDLKIWLANIPADTPVDHVHAAVAATHVYGRFPIADDLDAIDFKMPVRESFKEWKEKRNIKLALPERT